MTLPQIVSLVSTVILTTMAVIIGIQLVIILNHLKNSFLKLNSTLESAQTAFENLSKPAIGLVTMIEGLKHSSKIVDIITGFLSRRQTDEPIQLDNDFSHVPPRQ